MNSKEFQSDITVRPEVIGSPSLLVHFLENTSSQRALMQSSAITQAEIVSGCECSRIQTGFESKYGKYQFDSSARDQDIQIIDVIPKYKVNVRDDEIRSNPTLTVIYLGSDDGRIGYFDVDSYTELHSGFGYINKQMNRWRLQAGDFIPKDTKFVEAPNHDDSIYSLGVMANTCYMPMWDTTDDAFIISKSLAKKCEHTIIDTAVLNIRPDSIPLNLYGQGDVYKSFPDIGDKVRDDGLLMGFRQRNESTFLTDLTAEALSTPEHLHDDLFKAPPGATIIDIQIFTNQKVYPKLTEPQYKQLMQYQDQLNEYYAAVIDVYERLRKENHKFRPEFINLITEFKGWCYFRGGKGFTLMDKKEPINDILIRITYAYQNPIGIGAKQTGGDGSKGVVAAIWEDEDMPVSVHGVRADMLVTGESPFNRLNSGQLYEGYITLCAEVVAGNVAMGIIPDNAAFEYIIEFIHDVRPVYAKFIREQLNTDDLKEEFIDAVKHDGIYFIIPSFCENITPELITRLAKKYNVDRGPLTYHVRDTDGNRKQITTTCAGLVGSRYIYLLGKRPLDQLNVVEFGYVNQFMTPTKPNSKISKAQSLVGQTPMRYGEDESANLTSVIGAEATARIIGMYSNSPVAINKLATCLLTHPTPSALPNIGMTTKEIIETSSNIAMFRHQFAAIGYTLQEVEVEREVPSC